MKIVQIITRSDNIGGAQVHVRDLAQGLVKKGCNVHVLVGGKGSFVDDLKAAGVSVTSIPHLIRPIHPYYDWLAFLKIRHLLKKIKPNVVAVHSSKAGLLGRLAASSLHIPVVFTAHGWAFTEGVPPRRRKAYIIIEKFAALFASKVITVSNYDYNLCIKHRVVPKRKLVLIHNGVADICKEPRPVCSITPLSFIMTARLEEPKNHRMVLRALSYLPNRDWKVTFVGEGPLRTEIEQLITHLNLNKRVHLLGERHDVWKLLNETSCFLLISDWEGLPISIIEAMRAGLPIIASDVGGVSELVEDGENGFLIPRGDINKLVERLLLLLSNNEMRERMGMFSRQKYKRLFQIHTMVNKTFSVYCEIMKTQGKKRLSKS